MVWSDQESMLLTAAHTLDVGIRASPWNAHESAIMILLTAAVLTPAAVAGTPRNLVRNARRDTARRDDRSMRIAVQSSCMQRWPPTASPTWDSWQELKLLQLDPVITPHERCTYSSRGRWDPTNPRTKRAEGHSAKRRPQHAYRGAVKWHAALAADGVPHLGFFAGTEITPI